MNGKISLIAAALVGGLCFGAAAGAHERPSGGEAPACLKPAVWTALDGERPRPTSAPAVLAEMAKRDVVLLGEQHDQDDDHRWQLQVLAALHAQRPKMVIGFEMFPRRVQPTLDRWVAGELTVKAFLEEVEWGKVWNLPADLYLPLFQFARINRIPMLALNIDQKLSKTISEKGWDAVPADERDGVGRAAPPPDAYREFLFDVYRQHASRRGEDAGKLDMADSAFRYFVESQTTWDRAMAEGLAASTATAAEKPLAVGIMGSGHIRFGHGVPHQLADLGIRNIGSLLPLRPGADCDDLRQGLADAVFALPPMAATPTDPPRLGIRLEENDGGVRITEVTAGSLAESSGLKAGDRLVEVAGAPADKMQPMIALVRRQPGGTWLPLRVKRGDETLEVIIKFPVKS